MSNKNEFGNRFKESIPDLSQLGAQSWNFVKELILKTDKFIDGIQIDLKSILQIVTRIDSSFKHRLTIEDLQCMTYDEVKEILKFGQTTIDRMIVNGELTKITTSGHPRFNILQFAADIGLDAEEVKNRMEFRKGKQTQ